MLSAVPEHPPATRTPATAIAPTADEDGSVRLSLSLVVE
jgi:hypothetical protein